MRFICIWPDQLSFELEMMHSIAKDDCIVMIEDHHDTTFSPMHKKKIVFHWATMRHFANECRQRGHTVHYVSIDQAIAKHGWQHCMQSMIAAMNPSSVILTMPTDQRWRDDVEFLQTQITTHIYADNRHVMSQDEFTAWATDKKQLIMEFFYRQARVKTGLLMEDGKPIGGKWNYDKLNQKPPSQDMSIPQLHRCEMDEITQEVAKYVEENYSDHFGDIEPFVFATTRHGAQEQFEHFLTERLPLFGDYQDAMVTGESFMFHAVISMYINCGLLDPLECCQQAEQCYHSGHAPLNAVEGFVRQIIGWREYIRGIYLHHMPEYKNLNALSAKKPLPAFYWTGQSGMKCVDTAVEDTRKHAYAHHIQRLMVTGNFALIAGIDPQYVCDWYLSVYADAFEWVELPNTLGMSLYGDGGIVGSKPYASSGAYINKMSNYCKNCQFNVKEKFGDKACPFNVFYWDFLLRHEEKWDKNNRMKLMMTHVKRMSTDQKIKIQKQAEQTWQLLSGESRHE